MILRALQLGSLAEVRGDQTLAVARSLFDASSSEAEWRTVASRAYFAVFQHLVTHPRLSDYPLLMSGNDHKGLIEHLKNSSDPVLRKLGIRYLPRLRSLRNKADYNLMVPYTKRLALEALEDAEEIIYEMVPAVDSLASQSTRGKTSDR